MSDIFQIPASITSIKTMSKWWRFQIDSEEINDELIARMLKLRDKLGWFTFNVHQIEAEDIVNLPPLKKNIEEKKSKALLMRNVLYRIWEKDNEGMQDFELYYDIKMDKFINFLKEKHLT